MGNIPGKLLSHSREGLQPEKLKPRTFGRPFYVLDARRRAGLAEGPVASSLTAWASKLVLLHPKVAHIWQILWLTPGQLFSICTHSVKLRYIQMPSSTS